MAKLSEDLKQDHECGGFGQGLDGYHERAKELEDLLALCAKDLYSPSGKFKKSTALKVYHYVNANNVNVDT